MTTELTYTINLCPFQIIFYKKELKLIAGIIILLLFLI